MSSTLSTDEQSAERSATNQSSSTIVPTDMSGDTLTWEDNPAFLPGILYEAKRYYARTGHFEPLIHDGAVALPNGKLAIDNIDAILFIEKIIADPVAYNFDEPCPVTTQLRIDKHDAAAAAAGGQDFATKKAALANQPAANNYTVSKYTVQNKDRAFHESLLTMLRSSDVANEFTNASNGSGRRLISVMQQYANTASDTDKTLVTTELGNFLTKGYTGELDLAGFNAHYKLYNKLVQRKPQGTRPSENETMEMLKGIMHKDPNTRTLFEIKNEVANPGNVDDLVKLIRQMLRARKTAADLDNMTSGVAPNLSAFTADKLSEFTAQHLYGLLALGDDSQHRMAVVRDACASSGCHQERESEDDPPHRDGVVGEGGRTAAKDVDRTSTHRGLQGALSG